MGHGNRLQSQTRNNRTRKGTEMDKAQYPIKSVNGRRHDLDSHCTGKGKHSRTLAFKDNKTGKIEFRVDLVPGLPMPTEKQAKAIAARDGWPIGGTMVIDGVEKSSRWSSVLGCECVWMTLERF
jgi:hypothetical protein